MSNQELLPFEETLSLSEQENIEINLVACCENCESFEESSMSICDRGHCRKHYIKVWTFNGCKEHTFNWLFLAHLDENAKDFDNMDAEQKELNNVE